MKTILRVFLAVFLFSWFAIAEPAAVEQFRKHLADADTNKDGFVTKDELVREIGKGTQREAEQVVQIADAMVQNLDANKDARISAAEVVLGLKKVAENEMMKQGVAKAKKIMAALMEYADQHDGVGPAELKELIKGGSFDASLLLCAVPDGPEKSLDLSTQSEE